MAVLPPHPNQTRDAIYAAYEARSDSGWRPHLGASLIGDDCTRKLWFVFRWTLKVKFPGRILRLFKRGDLEEPRLVADLRAIGCTVQEVDPETGKQWRVEDVRGHFGGSLDGIVLGLPEAPKTWHLAEFKTHNKESFAKLVKDKVQIAKPEHYTQMQIYMHKKGLERAIYMAVNKDTDEIYPERISVDHEHALRMIAKAERIIDAPRPPSRPYSPDFWKCRSCNFQETCHGSQMPERNCRTCLHSTPVDNGEWHCAKWDDNIPLDVMKHGCASHRFIPDIVPGTFNGAEGERLNYTLKDGSAWVDG